MGKYSPIAELLRPHDRLSVSLSKLDALVGGLPASARTHREWWSNHAGNPQARDGWLSAGHVFVSLDNGLVEFRR